MATSVLSSVMDSEGKIAVPLEIREQLGLKAGGTVEFVTTDGRTQLRPAAEDVNPFDEFVGAVPVFANIEEVNAWVREMRDDEEGGLTKW